MIRRIKRWYWKRQFRNALLDAKFLREMCGTENAADLYRETNGHYQTLIARANHYFELISSLDADKD